MFKTARAVSRQLIADSLNVILWKVFNPLDLLWRYWVS
jgi:hypothetical protein